MDDHKSVMHPYRNQNAGSPQTRKQVESTELARFIKLAVLGFGEVHLPVDFLRTKKPRDQIRKKRKTETSIHAYA